MHSGNSMHTAILGVVNRCGRSKGTICNVCFLNKCLAEANSSLFHHFQHLHTIGHLLACLELEIGNVYVDNVAISQPSCKHLCGKHMQQLV